VLPWLPIQVILNFGIGYKQFTFEATKEGAQGLVPVGVAAADAGIVVGILLFFLWLGSNFQVRPDVHFARVPLPTPEELSRSRLAAMSPVVAVIVGLVSHDRDHLEDRARGDGRGRRQRSRRVVGDPARSRRCR